MEDKIKEICCCNCTLMDINSFYVNQFPVYLRGIATSKKNEIVLPGFSEAGNDVVISCIENILELILDEQGKPTDRPDDFNGYGILTRVAIYHGNPRSFEIMFVRNAFRNLGRLVQSMPEDKQKDIIPAILVYDSSKVKRVKSVEIALSHNLDLRKESLMRVYLLTQQFDLS